MDTRGLQSSRWAQTSRSNGPSYRSSDWDCPSCGFKNFAWRKECFRCPSLDSGISDSGKVMNIPRQPEKIVPLQETTNPPLPMRDTYGRADRLALPDADPLKDPRLYNEDRGLATSRWAPRNQSGRSAAGNGGEVWTRLAPIYTTTSESHTRSKPPSRAKSPGLGLPYEVQHFILSMMQRILEEGIYAFAARWMPAELEARRWDCPEAVELSTWRELLPHIVPLRSIVPIANYTLEEALRDAVKIRNAAAHRHLCDNTEIRLMASQAQDLMVMFSDVTRQSKFDRLRDELKDWDATSEVGMDAAQNVLQRALREINERPIDDMDWTPNTVSLRELTPVVHPVQLIEENVYDEMDLDME